MEEIGKKARAAARALALTHDAARNRALQMIAKELKRDADFIRRENARDLENAEKNGLDAAMIDRLTLTQERIEAMADGVAQIAALPDPTNREYGHTVRPNGLKVHRVTIPIGVIGIIYESRPNVTADAAALCLKSANAVVLRGGSEAYHSNRAIAALIRKSLRDTDMPEEAVQFVDTTDRQAVLDLLKQDKYIDMVIPRGGPGLIKFVSGNSTIPVVKHDAGVCSVYIHEDADPAMARDVAVNSKVQRPGVCNAAETLLVHAGFADHLPEVLKALADAGVEVRADARVREIYPQAAEATPDDWAEEYLALVIAVRMVDSMEEAIDHIETYGSHHTDAIVTSSQDTAAAFVRAVDSSAVVVNASTRFNDGGQFGLGAEMGISTQKLHCRGPMGLEELTTYKWVATGTGQVRE